MYLKCLRSFASKRFIVIIEGSCDVILFILLVFLGGELGKNNVTAGGIH